MRTARRTSYTLARTAWTSPATAARANSQVRIQKDTDHTVARPKAQFQYQEGMFDQKLTQVTDVLELFTDFD